MSDYKEQANLLREHADLIETSIELYGPSAIRLLVYDLRNAAAAIENMAKHITEMHERVTVLQIDRGHLETEVKEWRRLNNENLLPKRRQPHWVSVFDDLPRHNAVVVVSDGKRSWDVGQYHFLFKSDDRTIWWWKKHTTRKVLWWMYKEDALPEPPQEVQDGPIITPCRGCSDYDGYGGCKSKGGCARAKMEVQE